MFGIQQPHSQINIRVPNSVVESKDQNMVAIKKIDHFSFSPSDEIGLGMTSRVFKGKNDYTEQTVAIKVIDLKGNQDNLHNEFIKEEVQTLEKIKTLKTQNLLKLQAVIRSKNNLYIVTEFCEGKDIGKLLRNKKILAESQAQSILKQVINGYKQLNSIGIIHRDLKLSNLFVKKGKIKIADFGFAISQNKCNNVFGYNVGSPYYMPPQTLKFNRYSFYSDVWALGIMAFQLVYGRPPWKDKIDAHLYDLMIKNPVETLFDPQVKVSNDYKRFICKCLNLNINERMKPSELFGCSWPLAMPYIEGIIEQKKQPQVIKLPGHNYAVFNEESKSVTFESKKLDIEDFREKKANSSEIALIGQIDYVLFLSELYKMMTVEKSSEGKKIRVEIALLIKEKIKLLGEIVRSEKNLLQTPGFSSYVKSGGWQNLKQVIIRYDIQLRQLLKEEPPLHKLHQNSPPNYPVLKQFFFNLSQNIKKNAILLKYLISYIEVRQVESSSNPSNFAEHSGVQNLLRQIQTRKSMNSFQLAEVEKKVVGLRI